MRMRDDSAPSRPRLYLNGAIFNELSPELALFEKFIGTLDGRVVSVVASDPDRMHQSDPIGMSCGFPVLDLAFPPSLSPLLACVRGGAGAGGMTFDRVVRSPSFSVELSR